MKNLGVDIIYVISRTEDFSRFQELRQELSAVPNTSMNVVEATTGESLPTISELIDSKVLFPIFTDPMGLLTKNIIATAISHTKAVETFYNSEYDSCLILEDDVKFTSSFWRDLNSGKFSQFLKDIKTTDYDLIFWGRETNTYNSLIKQTGKITETLFKTQLNTNQYGAHAYQLSKKGAEKILDQIRPIKFAADVFLESCDLIRYSPEYCYFYQYRGDLPDYYKMKIKFHIDGVGTKGPISTTRLDIYDNYETVNETSHTRNVRECKIFRDIPIEKITFPIRKLPNSNVVENWASIHLKKQ